MEIFTKGADRFFSPKAPPFYNVLHVDELADGPPRNSGQ